MVLVIIPDQNQLSTKDFIIHLLLREHPLSVKKIWNRMRVFHNKSVSFQGVYKALTELMEVGVVVKTPEKEYEINIDWIISVKRFAEHAEKQYIGGQSTIMSFVK